MMLFAHIIGLLQLENSQAVTPVQSMMHWVAPPLQRTLQKVVPVQSMVHVEPL